MFGGKSRGILVAMQTTEIAQGRHDVRPKHGHIIGLYMGMRAGGPRYQATIGLKVNDFFMGGGCMYARGVAVNACIFKFLLPAFHISCKETF